MATVEERHPELFSPTKFVSPRGQKRTVPMEVLSLGFFRTGSACFKTAVMAALSILGIRSYHGLLLFSTQTGDYEMWEEAIERKYHSPLVEQRYGRAEFDQILGKFGAVADQPALAFSEDLIKAYPEAKVILVERDVDKWYPSYKKVVIDNNFGLINTLVAKMDPWMLGLLHRMTRKVLTSWLGNSTHDEMCLNAKKNYKEHYALIRRVTPPERLLEFNLEDGWTPLCDFLGKPVPDVPFPKVNEREWIEEKIKILIERRFKSSMRSAAPYGLLILVTLGAIAWRMSSQ